MWAAIRLRTSNRHGRDIARTRLTGTARTPIVAIRRRGTLMMFTSRMGHLRSQIPPYSRTRSQSYRHSPLWSTAYCWVLIILKKRRRSLMTESPHLLVSSLLLSSELMRVWKKAATLKARQKANNCQAAAIVTRIAQIVRKTLMSLWLSTRMKIMVRKRKKDV